VDFEEFDTLSEPMRRREEAMMASNGFSAFDGHTASASELASIEALLGVVLPAQYKTFMIRYGGGGFGFVELLLPVLGQPSDGREGVASVNREWFADRSFVAVAPVGTGDYWGFPVVDGRCLDEVWFHFHDGGDDELVASDFLEFVASRGLRP
jgi:hypothetical protein